MVKGHTIKLFLRNETPFLMTYVTHWFESGRVGDNFEWPRAIKSKDTHTVICYERDWSMAGCSGYVQYLVNGNTVTIAFSNPSAGTNKVGVGIAKDGNTVWENISSHDYQQFKKVVECGGVKVDVHCKCSGGTTNDATVHFLYEIPKLNVPPGCYPSVNMNVVYPPAYGR